MAYGLLLGFGHHFARLRVVQRVESQSQSSVHLHSGLSLRLRCRDRLLRAYRVVASVA
jgi:hypothetical protein